MTQRQSQSLFKRISDSFGFKQVPEFFASNPLEKVEELLEDDYA